MAEHENSRAAITNLQRYLRQLSYDEESIGTVPIDGIFESTTEDALREFQRLRGFPITGRADQQTWERLYDDYRSSLSRNSPPRAVTVFPLDPIGYVILPESRDFAVTVLQHMLLELHDLHRELEGVVVTGIYDGQTEDAVRFFQTMNGLPSNGRTDLLTWNTVADQYNALRARYVT